MANWYLGSTKWSAVPQWSAGTPVTVGDFVRQSTTPTVGSERVWRCTTGGTTGGTQPSWNLSKGSTTNDNGVIWTEVTGNDSYGWSSPHARLTTAFSWCAAGDIIFMSHDHAETQTTNLALTSPGTAASPIQILCVNDSSAPPTTLATTGTVSTTGGSNIALAGYAYAYGVTFSAGSGALTANITFIQTQPWWWKIESGGLSLPTTEANGDVQIGAVSTQQDENLLELINCNITFGHVGQGIIVRCPFIWRGGTVLTTAPTTLFQTPTAGNFGHSVIRGVDLSIMGSGKSLVDASAGGSNSYFFEKCKLGASVTIASGTIIGQGGVRVDLVNCDSGDTANRFAAYRYQGVVTQETTIVRTGGASADGIGVSRKMVTNANAKRFSPLEYDGIVLRNTATGSPITITVEIVTDNVTLKDNEAWIEVEHQGTTGYPLAVLETGRADLLSAGTNLATSSETWTTTGLSSPVKQSLSVSVTPEEVGDIRVRVCLAKPSTTMYVCPKLTVS